MVINGDGNQRRDLTHVSDVARAVELALHWPGPGSDALNVGTGRNHSVLDMLADAAKSAAETTKTLHFPGSDFTNFTPPVTHGMTHPVDMPEMPASIAETDGLRCHLAIPWFFYHQQIIFWHSLVAITTQQEQLSLKIGDVLNSRFQGIQ
jgi:hypothetical protein